MEEYGIDLLFAIPFELEFAALRPDEFVRRYLVEALKVRSLCVGANFNFGHRQCGTVETLRQWAREFELVEVAPVLFRDLPASSTRVREFILNGQVSRAARFLGRWFEIEGRIVSGAGRGRKVTVPTLNLSPANELLPKNGVYVSRISLGGGGFLEAVTNIGVRPTFDESGLTIETFVLRSRGEFDSPDASLQFLHRIRNEKRFDSPQDLAAQIQRDVHTASRFFQLMERSGHARAHTH
jgi:riboflavin kinase/FMN adenylyltransferase